MLMESDADEMIVLRRQVALVVRCEARMSAMFGVTLVYGDIHGDDGPDQQQWLAVEGEPPDRLRAKEYLRSLTAPSDTVTVDYPSQLRVLLTNPAVHARLEMQSRAALVFDAEAASLRILGENSLSVTLALSAVEDLINTFLQESEEGCAGEKKVVGSRRLDRELRRLSSQVGDAVDIPDTAAVSTTDAVKRATLLWLQENATPERIPRIMRPLPARCPARAPADSPASRVDSVSPSEGLSRVSLLSSGSDSEEDGVTSPAGREGPGVTSPLCEVPFLVQYALDEGYTQREIDAVRRAGRSPQMSTSHFLSLLVAQRDRQAAPRSAGSHLDSYLSRLQHHYREEEGSRCLDQLKRNNCMRQKLLKEAMRQQAGSARGTADAPLSVNDSDDSDGDDVHFMGLDFQTPPPRATAKSSVAPPGGADRLAAQSVKRKKFTNNSALPPRMPASQTAGGTVTASQTTSQTASQSKGDKVPGGRTVKQAASTTASGSQTASQTASDTVSASQTAGQADGDIVSRLMSVATGSGSSQRRSLNLRYVVIDGSNLAMAHGNNRVFSCKGIQLCVDYFLRRGHRQITAFVPHWRTEAPSPAYPISHQKILHSLKSSGYLVFTPSRKVPGKNIACYDDRFHLRLATTTDGVIVTNDNFRDLWEECPEWRGIIQNRLLMFTFVSDIFMVPDDPLGRHGPTLDQLLTAGGTTTAARLLQRGMPRDKYATSQRIQYHSQQNQNHAQQNYAHR